MGRVGACSLSGCRTAAMRRLLGLLVCLLGASYSQWGIPRESCYYDGEYDRCPAKAPDCDDDTGLCYYHYGKGCDIGDAGSCCSNSECERRTPDHPVCSERGYCQKPNYRPTGPGCRKERGRVKCDLSEHTGSCIVRPGRLPRGGTICEYASVAEPRKSTWGGGGLGYADKCAMLG